MNIDKLLEEADKILHEISVKGDDVFRLAKVRNILKDAYTRAKEVKTNG